MLAVVLPYMPAAIPLHWPGWQGVHWAVFFLFEYVPSGHTGGHVAEMLSLAQACRRVQTRPTGQSVHCGGESALHVPNKNWPDEHEPGLRHLWHTLSDVIVAGVDT